MTPEQEERIAIALEGIASGLGRLATVQENIFAKEYAEKKKPEDATITHIQTADDKLRQELGSTGEETLEQWMDMEALGPRERDYIRAEEEKRKTAEIKVPAAGVEGSSDQEERRPA